MELIVAGKPNKVIAQELGLAIRTVEKRRHEVLAKMEAELGRRTGRIGDRGPEFPMTVSSGSSVPVCLSSSIRNDIPFYGGPPRAPHLAVCG